MAIESYAEYKATLGERKREAGVAVVDKMRVGRGMAKLYWGS